MNIQTERLENHTARFTVELDNPRLEQAKQTAARNLAKRVNIPGFRKGKVPYKILVTYVGEAAILEDAIEILGNDIYKEALDQSGIDPYGPGSLEDFKVEPQPTFTFVVPMQPTVELGDYRSIRMEYSEPEVTDEMVDRSMRLLREQNAVIEESARPVAAGDRVTVDMYASLLDQPTAEKAEEADHDHEHSDEEHDHDHDHEGHDHHDHGLGGDEFIHEHDAVLVLGEDNEEPAPGFREALFGAALDEERTFEVTYPDDKEEYEELAGKRAKFLVKVKKIENMTLPALNDELAARVTEKEEKPLTLLELRMRMRENLAQSLQQRAKSDFASQALDEIVQKASISYPEALIEDQIERYMEQLDRDLRQRGLTLEDYIRLTGRTKEDIAAEYQEPAAQNVKRSLVLREVINAEKVEVPESRINEQIDKMLSQFGEQAESLRGVLDTPSMRENVRGDLLEQSVLDRIVAIVKGENPDAAPTTTEESATASDEASQEGETAE